MRVLSLLTLLGLLTLSTSVDAQSNISRPSTRLPMCLQYPDNKTYVPCTGVVPVDPVTGEPMGWNQALSGSNTSPTFTQETVRRSHWTETKAPLGANASFIGQSHDDDSPSEGGTSRWNNFSCLAWADKAGTLSIEVSTDNVTWTPIQTQAWSASTSMYLVQPLFTKYSRCKITNGSVAQSAFVVYSSLGF